MRALVLRHDHASQPGLVGDRLIERGYDLTTLTVVPEERFHSPDVTFAFPSAAEWDLVVSLGAPWSVYDEETIGTWIAGELALLREARDLGVPVLGICFGAQALATAFGGSVEPAPFPELGWTDVQSDIPDLVSSGPWFQWHYDRCVLPPGAVEIARNVAGLQAFVAGRSLGVQFHPEITAPVLRAWLDLDGGTLCARLGIDPDELVSRTLAERPQALARTAELVDAFLDRIALPVG
ncbi:type 1 glutamine amidotransferase [Nonomuraea angiospora]|uniref:GMP synthase-like glutamine amidotransferase n=1 Tax=Nonomuraea angiospora TaxID=46172 RepID=A0ABR9LPZ9_9ACTN|nr:type 1 glutamine amidotransferase [Nonomuraea angiospora]MBE1582729.1 GMP synthase-like glutamine amidotransferase [Nonomuraea angiospora]